MRALNGLKIIALFGFLISVGAIVPALAEEQASEPVDIKVTGLIQIWFLADQNPGQNISLPVMVPNALKISRTEIRLSGKGTDKDLSWLLMIDPARAIGTDETVPETKRILQDAILNWKFYQHYEVSVMQGKVPFGKEWLLSNGDLPFVERSPMTTVLKWGARDVGVMVKGSPELWGNEIVSQIGFFQGQGQNASTDANYVKDVAARVAVKSPSGLELGLSRYEGRIGANADYIGSPSNFNFRTGYEAGFSALPLVFESEYAVGNVKGIGSQTGYGDLIYSLNSNVELLGRYDWFILNDTNWNAGQQQEAILGLNWFFDPKNRARTKLQVNYAAAGPSSAFQQGNDLQMRVNFQEAF